MNANGDQTGLRAIVTVNRTGREDTLPAALSWLAHPISLAAIAVLVVNDHVLKHAWPGWVTGKLSDAAGLVMFPPVLACLLALVAPVRPRTAAISAMVAASTVFTLIKTIGPAADVASQVLTSLSGPSLVRADPTDLIALPAALLAWYAWRHHHPSPGLTARRVRLLVLLPLASLAIAATSYQDFPDTRDVELDGTTLIVYRGGQPLASNDAGLTFRELDVKRPDSKPSTQQCLDATCYRVVPGELHVQASTDGGSTWSTAWQISGAQWDDLSRRYWLGDDQPRPTSRSLVLLRSGDGYLVFVANSQDGLLRRNTDGTWQRLGYYNGQTYAMWVAPPRLKPTAEIEARTGIELVVLLLLALAPATLLAVRGRRRSWVAPVLTVAVFMLGTMGLLIPDMPLQPVILAAFLLAGAGGLGIIVAGVGALVRSGRLVWHAPVMVFGLAVACALLARWLRLDVLVAFILPIPLLAMLVLLAGTVTANSVLLKRGQRESRAPVAPIS